MNEIRQGDLRQQFNLSNNRPLGLNNLGQPVDDDLATAISYQDCIDFCPGGAGQEPFSWSMFSRQTTAWLLPWLALLSQLPFGAMDRVDNFMSMVITLGSPTLAAYSLILTLLNEYHVANQFSHIAFPNSQNAMRVLASLQQVPLRIKTEDGLLASLVVLPQNDEWWKRMVALLDFKHTWSISALSGISWAVIAYILTVTDSFASVRQSFLPAVSDGPVVGSLWLWVCLITYKILYG